MFRAHHSAAVLSTLALLFCVAEVARAQGGGGTKVERPAIVNGEAITAEDVAGYARLLMDERPEVDPAMARQLARRSIAEEILLATELERLGVKLDERVVDEYWERRRGSKPDYDALATQTGTSAERQRTLARRAALAELYLMHRVGMRTEYVRLIAPDPLMVRLVTVTPSQLREAFAANRAYFDMPDTVDCDVYTCTDQAGARTVLASLEPGGPPSLIVPLHRSYAMPSLRGLFPEDVATFLTDAPSGTTRIIEATEGTLVVQVTGRQSGRPTTFAESQERLRRLLQNELLAEARRNLIVDLAQHATFWPTDLFAGEPPAPPSPLKVPADVTPPPLSEDLP